MNSRTLLYQQIDDERDYQDEKWGYAFDDMHTPADWWTFVSLYFAKALPAWKVKGYSVPHRELRAGLVKVAAVLIAWVESLDRQEAQGK